ncbi:MAG: hypothetical protein ACRD50_10600 [Candidatus Acidiferrales bacterium]
MRGGWMCVAAAATAFLLAAGAAYGQDTASGSGGGYWADWFARVNKTQAEQPHWITPLVTVTPRLEEEYRYDQFWQTNSKGVTTNNFDGGKGVELIPFRRVELILSTPAYIEHNNPAVKDGFGDFSFLMKYRIFQGNEQHGNYILTAFLGASIPTGSGTNGAKDAIVTPTIAYGKGFGHFDAQGTLGVALPTGDTNLIGRTIVWNNAFQYHVFRKLWPEVELNSSFFQDGKNDGRKQTFVTPGMVIGRIHLVGRLGLTFGGGFQIATTHFHNNNHNGIFTVRFPF